MTLSQEFIHSLVCPITHGALYYDEEKGGLVSTKAGVVFPVKNGIPILLEDEAYPIQEGGPVMSSQERRLAVFEIMEGANQGEVIKLPVGTCKAIGRSLEDMNKTQVFHADFTMSLDDLTKKLIMNYVSKNTAQKSEEKAATKSEAISQELVGGFKRLPDLVLEDPAISRLHAMMFHDSQGAGILDLVSKNGTFVNGKEIESHTLSDGDVVEVGKSRFVFSYQ